MTDMVQPEIMQDHRIPVIVFKLGRDVSGHIVIHLRKVLYPVSLRPFRVPELGVSYSHEKA